jgi:hypothetical protein
VTGIIRPVVQIVPLKVGGVPYERSVPQRWLGSPVLFSSGVKEYGRVRTGQRVFELEMSLVKLQTNDVAAPTRATQFADGAPRGRARL